MHIFRVVVKLDDIKSIAGGKISVGFDLCLNYETGFWGNSDEEIREKFDIKGEVIRPE